MAYQDYEDSVDEGKPVELHDLLAATGEHWRYTTASETVTYQSYDYEPEVIDRSDLELGRNHEVNAVQVKFGRSNDFANQFISAPVEGIVTDTIYRGHEGEWVTFWHGTMVSIRFDKNAVATARFEPRTSSLPRVGTRRRNQRLCDHALYSSGCRANDAAYMKSGTVSVVDGVTVTAAVFATEADGWWVAGKLSFGTAKRLIKAHAGSVVTLDRSISDLDVGSAFDVYPGCDHSPTTCDTKFGNKLNYGGNEFLPTKNPYELNILW
jgi:uncharacterized phage protein (TIGR02218 family)